MKIKFSHELDSALTYARDEAMRTGSYGIRADHLMLGILRHGDNEACRCLESAGISTAGLKEAVDNAIFCDNSIPYNEIDRVGLTRGARSIISASAFEALRRGQREVLCAHLLLAIIRVPGTACGEFLSAGGATYDSLSEILRGTLPTAEESAASLPRLEDIAGALAEQISNTLGPAGSGTPFPS